MLDPVANSITFAPSLELAKAAIKSKITLSSSLLLILTKMCESKSTAAHITSRVPSDGARNLVWAFLGEDLYCCVQAHKTFG